MAPNARGSIRSKKYGNRESRRNHLLGVKAKEGDSNSAIPLLRFGLINEWLKLKAKISNSCLEKYGNIGRHIETKEYYIPPEIAGHRMDRYFGWETEKLKDMLYMVEGKARTKNIWQMDESRVKMYAYILSKLSKETLQESNHHDYCNLIRGDLSVL